MGKIIFAPIQNHPQLELVLVMLLGPVIMNTFQFWLNDNILMSSRFKSHNHKYQEIEEKEEAFGEVDPEFAFVGKERERSSSERDSLNVGINM